MVLTAAERTMEVLSIRVPRVRQKANRAVAAPDRTACQTGIIAQDRIQRGLILTNKRKNAIVLMPIRAKRKEFPGGYDENPRFSVKMLICSDTPSSYELDANASRARARFFYGSAQKDSRPGRTADPSANALLNSLVCAIDHASPCPTNLLLLLGKRGQVLPNSVKRARLLLSKEWSPLAE